MGDTISPFKILVSENFEYFSDLWPRSDRMGSAHCYAFQCADILALWCDTIGRARGTHPLFVAVFDEASRPLLLLPLGIERIDGMRVLGFLDGGVSDYNAPVVFEPTRVWDAATTRTLWRELVRALPRFDIVTFEKMPADICGLPNPLANLKVVPSAPSGHFVNLTTSWNEQAAKHLPFNRETQAQRRRLARLGHVNFIVAEHPTDRQRILEAMLSQKSRRYLETWGVDGLDRPGYRSYYTALIERLPCPGPCLVSALEINGKVISTNWGFLVKRRFIGIVMTFEGGEWKRFSPGKLLLEDLLNWCFDNGVHIFDFGVGDETYKVAYTDQTLPLYRGTIAITIAGKAHVFVRNSRTWQRLRRAPRKLITKLGFRAVNSDGADT
jgi:CelD/BcsL family acetyltransferase involved in cellulose biosynthesis